MGLHRIMPYKEGILVVKYLTLVCSKLSVLCWEGEEVYQVFQTAAFREIKRAFTFNYMRYVRL